MTHAYSIGHTVPVSSSSLDFEVSRRKQDHEVDSNSEQKNKRRRDSKAFVLVFERWIWFDDNGLFLAKFTLALCVQVQESKQASLAFVIYFAVQTDDRLDISDRHVRPVAF